MASFSIVIDKKAVAELLDVPFPFRRQINQRIFKLKTDPRPPACEFVVEDEHYRILVAGWWVIYHVDDAKELVTVLVIVAAEA